MKTTKILSGLKITHLEGVRGNMTLIKRTDLETKFPFLSEAGLTAEAVTQTTTTPMYQGASGMSPRLSPKHPGFAMINVHTGLSHILGLCQMPAYQRHRPGLPCTALAHPLLCQFPSQSLWSPALGHTDMVTATSLGDNESSLRAETAHYIASAPTSHDLSLSD